MLTTSRLRLLYSRWQGQTGTHLYVMAVAGTGLAALILIFPASHTLDWQLIALLAVLGAAAQLLPVSLLGQTSVSPAFAVAYAGMLVLGPIGGAVANIASIAVYARFPVVRPPFKVVFTAGSLILSTVAGAGCYALVGGEFPPGNSLITLPAALAGAFVYYLVNTLSVAIAIALDSRRPLISLWTANYLWLALHYLIMGGIGLAMAAAYTLVGPLGLLFFALPLVLPWYSIRMFMARTNEVLERNVQLAGTNEELHAANEALTRRVQELRALHGIGLALTSSLNLEDVLTRIVSTAADLTGADASAIYLLEPDGETLRIAGQRGLSAVYLARPEPTLNGSAKRALREHRRLVVDGESGSLDMLSVPAVEDGFVAAACLPLAVAGERLGLIDVAFRSPHRFSEAEIRVLDILAEQAAVAIQNARLVDQVGEAEALRELSRLKTEFVATVSHELRSPLTALVGFSELLAFGSFSAEQSREMAEKLNREAIRMTSLVDDLLELSRIESGRLRLNREEIHLGQLAAEAVERFTKSARTHPIRLVLPPLMPPALVDPNRIAQVLDNLIGNAIRYSPGTGSIIVEIGPAGQLTHESGWASSEPGIRQQVQGTGEWIEVAVRDRGIGIPADKITRIFEKFYRVENEVTRSIRGTGLGLSICQYIIEAHGGHLWVESAEGRGSIFRFVVPSAVGREASIIQPEHVSEPAHTHNR